MARASIDLPLTITMTTAGVEWFERNHKMLKRLQMADNRLVYGIALAAVPASFLQKMINADYIASVELARSEFSSKSAQIVDLTKLIVHRILFKRFECETFRMLADSPLFTRWNRENPDWSIGKDIDSNRERVDSLFDDLAPVISAVSLDIQAPLLLKYTSNKALSEDERRRRTFLSAGFALRAAKPLWCVLAKTSGRPEYQALGRELCGMLEAFVEKAIISEQIAFIVTELLGFVEIGHFKQVALLLRGRGNATATGQQIRDDVRRHMEAAGDLLSLTYELDGKEASMGTAHRLRVTIQEQGDQEVKERVEAFVGIDTRESTLPGSPRGIHRSRVNAERDLRSLSSLRRECEKQNVGVRISTSQIPRRNLSLINCAFQL